ncbi:MAG: DUF5615 family PIN-like protein [Candidatus Dormibacteraeota bacterium]|uniref:DUF5615 family PIN-like protein n=1 Tax=Candidatus Amunia macphersoniae TaxID=3127014 RepID=A0A934NDW6_9BACT|nr:DUF5615 family PIN-like protein [Candidatus Dormibacteraeota bacterium]
MFAPGIAEELRRRGHDVVAVAADPQLRSMTDPEVWAWAVETGRRIVTENVKDFRRLLADADGRGAPGLLFTSSRTFPRNRQAPGRILAALETWLTAATVTDPPPEDWLAPADEQ